MRTCENLEGPRADAKSKCLALSGQEAKPDVKMEEVKQSCTFNATFVWLAMNYITCHTDTPFLQWVFLNCFGAPI